MVICAIILRISSGPYLIFILTDQVLLLLIILLLLLLLLLLALPGKSQVSLERRPPVLGGQLE